MVDTTPELNPPEVELLIRDDAGSLVYRGRFSSLDEAEEFADTWLEHSPDHRVTFGDLVIVDQLHEVVDLTDADLDYPERPGGPTG